MRLKQCTTPRAPLTQRCKPEDAISSNKSDNVIMVLVVSVIQTLIALINDPEPEHPLRADLAEEFLRDRRKFVKNAEEFTKKHAEKRRESSSAD